MYLLTIESDDAESIISILCSAGKLGVKSAVINAGELEPSPPQSKQFEVAPAPPKAERHQSTIVTKSNSTWDILMSLVNDKQMILLRTIKSNPEGIKSQGLASALGDVDLRAVGGVLGAGLKHNILKAGFKEGEVIITRGYGVGRIYFPGPVLFSQELQLTQKYTDTGIVRSYPPETIPPPRKKRRLKDRSNAPKLVEAIQIVMHDKDLTSREVYELLDARGWLPESNDPMVHIRYTLSSNELFQRSGKRGVYHLVSDNPHLKSESTPNKPLTTLTPVHTRHHSSPPEEPLGEGDFLSGRPLSETESQNIVDLMMQDKIPVD